MFFLLWRKPPLSHLGSVDVKDLDTGVSAPKFIEAITDTQMTRSIRVTDHYDRRNWLQRAKIVFIFLHPNIGAKHSADTAAFTGVKENTLLTWLYQKKNDSRVVAFS